MWQIHERLLIYYKNPQRGHSTVFQGQWLRRINLMFGFTAQNWFQVISLHVAPINCKKIQWYKEEHRFFLTDLVPWTSKNNFEPGQLFFFSHSCSPSSSSFPLLISIFSHDDLFLFYWCRYRTSTMRSRWFAMKIPWAIAPKVHKSGSIFLYIQKQLKRPSLASSVLDDLPPRLLPCGNWTCCLWV